MLLHILVTNFTMTITEWFYLTHEIGTCNRILHTITHEFHCHLLFTSCYFSVFVSIRFTVSSKITLTIICDITQLTLLRLNVTIVQFCKKLLTGKVLRNLIRHSSSWEERVSKKKKENYHISSNNSRRWLFLFLHQKGANIRGKAIIWGRRLLHM